MTIAEKWNWDWTLDYCVWHDGHCWSLPFRGRGPDGQSLWVSGWRAPSAAGWCQCSCGGQCTVVRLGCFGWFRGNGVSLQLWKVKWMQCPYSDFENLLVAAAGWGFRAEMQAFLAPGHQKADRLLKWGTFLYFQQHAYIFSTGSETLHWTSSNFVLLSVPSQRIVQPDYIHAAKSTAPSDFIQYFST